MRRPRWIWALGTVGGAAVALATLLAIQAGSAAPRPDGPRALPAVVTAEGLAERVGVRVVRVVVSGGGGLLDLRYQVIDPGRAGAVHDRATPPAIVDETSGGVGDRLFMGHMHHGQLKAGVTYYLVFANTQAVRRGDPVSVVLGDARLQHVRVQ